jgi:hypothetical protein
MFYFLLKPMRDVSSYSQILIFLEGGMSFWSWNVWSAYAECVLDRMALCLVLADPQQSPALRTFVTEVVHQEATALLREHREVIRMQREEIAALNLKLKQLQQDVVPYAL